MKQDNLSAEMIKGGVFSDFCRAVTKGDLFVKLSLLWMGAGYARRKQYIKAAIMTLFEIAVIVFTFRFAMEYVPKFAGLGSVMPQKTFNTPLYNFLKIR